LSCGLWWPGCPQGATLRVAGEKDWGINELAERLGVNRDTLRRKLYGEAPATIDDVTAWALVVEAVTVLPAPPDLERMLPPPD
jgi:transcriptional regulator with XRE-family HTH domain